MNTVTIERTTLDTQPWYKQFWPWFLISLPLSAVIAGITTLFIAMDKPDGLVVDDYYKEGLGINRELAREQMAKQLDIGAQLHISNNQLTLQLNGKMPLPEKLSIYFIHPTKAEDDKHWTLIKNNQNQYTAMISSLAGVNWYIKIKSVQGHWSLNGRFNPQQSNRLELKALASNN